MFETRKYTKIIESFWDQHKEYIKEIKESKKAMEYLKRIYEEDNRRKRLALREMEHVLEETEQVEVMKEALKKLSVSPNASKEASDRKYQLVMKRGSIQERINVGVRSIKELNGKMVAINREYSSIFGSEIAIKIGKNTNEISAIDRRVAVLANQKEEMQKLLEETQSATAFTQKQMEVMGEVKRAKQCLPELKNENSEDEILRKLQDKCEQMEARRGELSKLKKQRDQMVLPTLLDLPLTEAAYLEQKRALATESQMFDEAKLEVLRMFSSLYKAVSPRRPEGYDSSVE
jgi:hypothetical protein